MIMKRLIRRTASLLAMLLVLGFAPFAGAGVIFESETLGETGVTWADLLDETVRGSNVSNAVFPGVRFFLDQPVLTTQIGGHFLSSSSGTFFGAIVGLDDANDFPDSDDLSSSDVLGHTELTFPISSDEVFGDLGLSLDSGWYALVFGSGLFGTLGDGAAPRNNTDIGGPAYVGFQPGAGWFNLTDLSDVGTLVDHRFALLGSVVPEPSTFCFVLIGTLCFAPLGIRFARK